MDEENTDSGKTITPGSTIKPESVNAGNTQIKTAGTYTVAGGNYASYDTEDYSLFDYHERFETIAIDTDGDVTLDIQGNINFTEGGKTFIRVKNVGKLTINGNGHTLKTCVDGGKDSSYLIWVDSSATNANIVVNNCTLETNYGTAVKANAGAVTLNNTTLSGDGNYFGYSTVASGSKLVVGSGCKIDLTGRVSGEWVQNSGTVEMKSGVTFGDKTNWITLNSDATIAFASGANYSINVYPKNLSEQKRKLANGNYASSIKLVDSSGDALSGYEVKYEDGATYAVKVVPTADDFDAAAVTEFSAAYNGKAITKPEPTLKKEGFTVTYKYFDSNNKEVTDITDAGTYTVKAYVAGTEVEGAAWQFKVDPLVLSADCFDVRLNGALISGKLNDKVIEGSAWNVSITPKAEYSFLNESDYQVRYQHLVESTKIYDDPTEVPAGRYKAFINVDQANKNLAPIGGELGTVEVEKKPYISARVTQDGTYTGEELSPVLKATDSSYTFVSAEFYSKDDPKCTGTPVTVKDAGDYYAKAIFKKDGVQLAPTVVYVKINKAELTEGAVTVTATVNGEAKTLTSGDALTITEGDDWSVSAKADGYDGEAKVYYRSAAGSDWTESKANIKDVGSYEIRVELPETKNFAKADFHGWKFDIKAKPAKTRPVTIEGGKTDKDSYAVGETVTITPTIAEGYELDKITVKSGDKELDVTDNKDGTYSFEMPENSVTVTVATKKKETPKPAETRPTAADFTLQKNEDGTSTLVCKNDDLTKDDYTITYWQKDGDSWTELKAAPAAGDAGDYKATVKDKDGNIVKTTDDKDAEWLFSIEKSEPSKPEEPKPGDDEKDKELVIDPSTGVPTEDGGKNWSYDEDQNLLTIQPGAEISLNEKAPVKVDIKNDGTLKKGAYEGTVTGGTIAGGTYLEVKDADAVTGGVFAQKPEVKQNGKLNPMDLLKVVDADDTLMKQCTINDIITPADPAQLALYAENAAGDVQPVAYIVGDQNVTIRYTGSSEKFNGWTSQDIDLTKATLSEDGKAVTFAIAAIGDQVVTVKAAYKADEPVNPVEPDQPDEPAVTEPDALHVATVAVGTAAFVGAVALPVYGLATEAYIRAAMPAGIAVPADRIELAKLLWQQAGKPEPASAELFEDIAADDTAAQKAARWVVEQGLLKVSEGKPAEFRAAKAVTRLRVCLTWHEAKAKGLVQ